MLVILSLLVRTKSPVPGSGVVNACARLLPTPLLLVNSVWTEVNATSAMIAPIEKD